MIGALAGNRSNIRPVDTEIGKLAIRKLSKLAYANPPTVPAPDRLNNVLQHVSPLGLGKAFIGQSCE
jgi:hypothetical protein